MEGGGHDAVPFCDKPWNGAGRRTLSP